jgi:thiol:disulfide interchange protein
MPVALVAAGVACGAAPGAASSGLAASPPIVTIPADENAPILASGVGVASTSLPASPRPAAITWVTSERDARDRARKQNLPLLVYVRADWAAACLEMEHSAWLDPRVIDAARRFVPLQLDVSAAEGDAELYAQRYGVSSIPEIIVVDPAGRTVARSAGAPAVDTLVTLLRGAAGE